MRGRRDRTAPRHPRPGSARTTPIGLRQFRHRLERYPGRYQHRFSTGSGNDGKYLRLGIGDATIAYTGDTAWTENLTAAAADTDLLIAESYYYDKLVPYHLRYADLVTHRASLNSRRIVLTHMSAGMLTRAAEGKLAFETARDGLTIQL